MSRLLSFLTPGKCQSIISSKNNDYWSGLTSKTGSPFRLEGGETFPNFCCCLFFFLGEMNIRVISFDTIILVIQGWLKIALCIYGVSVCCCKRSKVKPNFDCLQRVDSAIVCIYQATIVTSSEVPKGRFRKAISHYFTGFLARISQFDQMTSQGFCISMSMWWPKTEDIGIHIKRSSKWYSHLTCTAVCVQ